MVLLVFIFLILSLPVAAEEVKSLDRYYEEAAKAIANENYETAVKILTEAKQKYPRASRLHLLTADLYYEKELYNLALDEYLQAEKKGEDDHYTLNQIAHSYGKLNQEQDAIRYMEKILKDNPDNVTTIDDLGWMYFKTFQLEKGEKLLREALDRYGPDRSFFMTLGTLYSGMYDYEDSRRFYLRAIEEAEKAKDSYFASVAYYNLSLLEHSFYYYNSALRYTEESIYNADRASGHLARGELFQSRMAFKQALLEYQKALAKDTTPLSKVNLATLYQKFGRLELARRYIEEVMTSKDLAWMYYYGTDVERHYKDIHEILADIYQGLSRVELMRPTASFPARIKNAFLSLKYRIIGYYHRQKFRLYSLQMGRTLLEEKSLLDAYWEFYRGNEGYPEIALKYLYKARRFETEVAPHSAVYYQQEEGKILRSPALLKETLPALDSFWEKEGLSESLRLLVPLLKKGSIERREAINRLYEINPGGLLQYGFGLPLHLEIIHEQPSRRDGRIRLIMKFLRRAGSELALEEEAEGFKYTLVVRLSGPDRATFILKDREKGAVIVRDTVDLSVFGRRPKRQAAGLVESIMEKIYEVRT